MSSLKRYNAETSEWEYVAIGKQGIVGPTGPTGPGVATGGTTGQILSKVDSTNFNTEWVTQEGYRFVQTLYYTSSGTFIKANYPWLRAIRVKLVGGGGGGCGGLPTDATQTSTGNGGSGAAYAESFITNIAGLASSVTVTRGAGGAGGVGGTTGGIGGTGGTSSFGTLVIADGGLGGENYLVSAFPRYESSRPGQDDALGDITQDGGPSLPFAVHGVGLRQGIHGGGGSSALGAATFQTRTGGSQNVPGGDGSAGNLYGGGGGAAYGRASTTSGGTGGAGGNGIVIVELYA
jgi:hypothetical protein